MVDPKAGSSAGGTEASNLPGWEELARESLQAAPHVQVAPVWREIGKKWLATGHLIWD
jgi:hypothetical protein